MHEDFIRNFFFINNYLAFPTMAAIVNKFDLITPFMANHDFPEISPFQILHA